MGRERLLIYLDGWVDASVGSACHFYGWRNGYKRRQKRAGVNLSALR